MGFRKTLLDTKWRVDKEVRQETGRAETKLMGVGGKQERSLDHDCTEEGAGKEDVR